MSNKIYLLFILVITITPFACREDIDRTQHGTYEDPPEVYVNCSVTGVVKDDKGQPLKDVMLTLDNYMEFSDDNGVFYFKDVQANQNTAVVHAKLDGYFDGSVSFIPIVNNVHLIEIVLKKTNFTGDVDGLSGGVVSDANVRIEVPPNAIQKHGIPVQAKVKVFLQSYLPSDHSLPETWPGSLTGIGPGDSLVALIPVLSMRLEVQSEAGEPLVFVPGKAAIINLPALASIEPALRHELLLWHYNPVSGFWDDMGNNEALSKMLQGKIGQTGWWLISPKYERTMVKLSLQTDGRIPFPYTRMRVRQSNSGAPLTRLNLSDKGNARISLPVRTELEFSPENAELTVDRKDYVFEGEEGALNLLLHPNPNIRFMYARMINCEGSAVRWGYYKMQMDSVILSVFPFRGASIDPVKWPVVLHPGAFRSIALVGGDFSTGATGVAVQPVETADGWHSEDIFVCKEGKRSFIRLQRDGDPSTVAAPLEIVNERDSLLVMEKDFIDGMHLVLVLPFDLSVSSTEAISLRIAGGGFEIMTGMNVDGKVELEMEKVGKSEGDIIKGKFFCKYHTSKGMHSLKADFKAIRR